MPLLLILFIVVPIAELYVIIQVGQAIGVLPTLALLLVSAVLGSLLLRQQGRSAWRRFNAALDERRFPGREVADGLMITIGGTLLVTPGFISDALGLLLLVPPSRAVIRRGLWAVLGRRFRLVSGPAGWGHERMRGTAGGPPGGRPYDVEGSAQEVPGAEPPRSGDVPGGADHVDREIPPPRP